ncbi:hypothetical protein HIMB5_00011100 [alpha proteobacterium HIMB5]|nr:hypothetical protein HIMB5_00011100 [alpha proteobacterium HIMB5]
MIIRRGISEVEWLIPIIDSKDFNFELYTFYLTQDAYESCLRSTSIIKILQKKQKNFFILKKNHKLFFRILLKTSNYFQKNFYDISFIKRKLNLSLNTKFDIVLSEFGNYSNWIQAFQKFDNSKIVKVPSTPTTFVNIAKKEVIRKIDCDFLIINNSTNLKYWSRFANKKKIKYFGVPIFDKTWVKKKIKKTKVKKDKIKILFAYSSYFGLANNKEFKILENQFISVMDSLSNIKNIQVTFKIHPEKNDPYFKELLKKYSNNFKILSNDYIYSLAYKSDILITSFESAAALYGCFFSKPCIELWKGVNSIFDQNFSKSNNGSIKILKPSSNIKDFNKKIHQAINHLNNKSKDFNKEFNNFRKIYFEKKNTIYEICTFLKEI